MRRVICVCLLLLPVRAGGSKESTEFRERYRAAADAGERGAAIRLFAETDRPEAAELLFALWKRLEGERAKVRKQLTAQRRKRRALEEKADRATGDAQRRILNAIVAVEARELAADKRIGGIERERYAILDGLRRMRSKAAREWFSTKGLALARSPLLLRAAAGQAARVAPDAVVERIAGEQRAKRLVPLLDGLAHEEAKAAADIGPVIGQLGHRDWAVRAAAARALAQAGRPEGVGPVVEAFGRQPRRSRAAIEMLRALRKLTGRKFGPYPEHWTRWWASNKEAVLEGGVELGAGKPDEKSPRPDRGHFYGIPIEVDRIIYVFDKSGSMEVSMENPRWEGESPIPAPDDEETRFEAAARELLRAVKRLTKGSSFGVILYDNHARKLHDRLVPAGPKQQAGLKSTLAREGPSGATNIYEALDMALKMANVHSGLTRGEQRADAIFLVSDGAPTDMKGKPTDPERILQAVREWNALKRITIHCIGIGARHNAAFLAGLARENGGRYYAVVPPKPKR